MRGVKQWLYDERVNVGVYDPFEAKDFTGIDRCHDDDDLPCVRAAALANAKFHLVIENWVPMSLMKMIGEDKNNLEKRLRELELELTKFRELMGLRLDGKAE